MLYWHQWWILSWYGRWSKIINYDLYERAYLKRVQKPRVILYLLLTSQPYFLAVSTGNLFWGRTGLQYQASVGCLKSLPLFWYWDKDLDRLFLFRCFVWFLFWWDGVSGKNTRFPGLITGLCQEGHPAVKIFASILNESCVKYERIVSKG